jgi:hypothetical protein
MKLSILVFFAILVIACITNVEKNIDEWENDKNRISQVTLLDTIKIVDSIKIYQGYATDSFISKAQFYPLYFGTLHDTIPVDYQLNTSKFEQFEGNHKSPDTNNIKIFVDTSRIISNMHPTPIPPPPPPGTTNKYFTKEQDWIKIGYYAHPVFLKNTDSVTVDIGYGRYVKLIIEAMDESGKWKPIQQAYRYFCATGLNDLYLPPKNYVLTSCKIYEGEFKTKMRLKFGFKNHVYSNEFYGRINPSQFVFKKYY